MALIDNLIGYWKLDEASGDAVDSHGSNTLTETGGTIASATGIINNARDFEAGDTEGFVLADNTDLSTGDIDFTFSCWINMETKPATYPAILGKWPLSAGTREFSLFYDSGNDKFGWTVTANGTTTTDLLASTFGSPSVATWYFIVAWHDAAANQIGISVNAGTADTAAHSGGVLDSTNPFELGASSNGAERFWDGLIDEVGFWKRVLTSDERTQLYNGGAGLAYPFAASGTSPPEVPYRLRGGGIAEIAWPVWGQSFRF